ncbi:hypothetical protein [Bradyrhizobium guangzhouense]|uniref:Uncharacterized protein n=1 Tax=Bradyrhizobium guangzhouense TaxID=1325095 RepID=A0AAE5X4X9_9BRAD|nr:hypothetical protein [Bradyrhizobium guangzhouense]QAU48768.1 hypothetical protein XH91_27720 [Bradyrhizobium guangzhouense]RXH09199.1 hypothetical protein EAS56_26445 [Bradyrhizobium guangzhouense]
MNRILPLRIIGICTALVLALYAGLAFFSDLVRPDFRAGDLFSGVVPPDDVNPTNARLATRFSFDGDLLANDASAKAASVLHRPASDTTKRTEENKAAQDAVTSALKVSPIRPALWLTLSTLKAQVGEPTTPALKMSYLTGAVPVDVAFSRVQTVTSSVAAADDEIRLLAQSDIRSALANRARYAPLLIAAYVQATPQGKSLLMESAQMIDPKFKDILLRY